MKSRKLKMKNSSRIVVKVNSKSKKKRVLNSSISVMMNIRDKRKSSSLILIFKGSKLNYKLKKGLR